MFDISLFIYEIYDKGRRYMAWKSVKFPAVPRIGDAILSGGRRAHRVVEVVWAASDSGEFRRVQITLEPLGIAKPADLKRSGWELIADRKKQEKPPSSTGSKSV